MKYLIFLASLMISTVAIAQSNLNEISSLPSCEVSGFSQHCYERVNGELVIGGAFNIPGCKITCPENKTPTCFAGTSPKFCSYDVIAPKCQCN